MHEKRTPIRKTAESDIRWLACINTSGEAIPPFAVVRIVELNSDGVHEVDKPNTDSDVSNIGFNGGATIEVDGLGKFTMEPPAWAAFTTAGATSDFDFSDSDSDSDSDDDTIPLPGETWGPKAGSWYIHPQQTGLIVLSGNYFDLNAVWVQVLRGGTGDVGAYVEASFIECLNFQRISV